MDPNWLKDQHKIYNSEKEKLAKLLRLPINIEVVQSTLEKNVAELSAKEAELRKNIENESKPERKIVLYYQLMTTVNLLNGNKMLLDVLRHDKENISSTDELSKRLNAELDFLAIKMQHLHENIQELQDECLKRSLHQAILELDHTVLADKKEHTQELHYAHHSMSELKRATLSKEYQDISNAIKDSYQTEYIIYHNLAQHCQTLIHASDNYKTTQKESWRPEMTKSDVVKEQSVSQQYNIAKKRQILSHPKIDIELQKYELQQKSGLALLQQDESILEKRKAQLVEYMASGTVDKTKLESLRSEITLINFAQNKIKETRNIVMHDRLSSEYLNKKDVKDVNEKSFKEKVRSKM